MSTIPFLENEKTMCPNCLTRRPFIWKLEKEYVCAECGTRWEHSRKVTLAEAIKVDHPSTNEEIRQLQKYIDNFYKEK